MKYWDQKQKTGLILAVVSGTVMLTSLAVDLLFEGLLKDYILNIAGMCSFLGFCTGSLMVVWKDYR